MNYQYKIPFNDIKMHVCCKLNSNYDFGVYIPKHDLYNGKNTYDYNYCILTYIIPTIELILLNNEIKHTIIHDKRKKEIIIFTYVPINPRTSIELHSQNLGFDQVF